MNAHGITPIVNGRFALPPHAQGVLPERDYHIPAGNAGMVEELAAPSGDYELVPSHANTCDECGSEQQCDACMLGMVGNG